MDLSNVVYKLSFDPKQMMCHYCGVVTRFVPSVDGEITPPDARTKDHALPKSRGGPNTSENLVTCCARCNNEKGSLTYEEYRAVWGFRKNAAVIKDMKIFAGEVWVPKPAYISPPIPVPPPSIYGQIQAMVGMIVGTAILRLSALRTLL